MKQQLFKASFICMAAIFLPQIAYAVEINEANFPDANFRNYLLKQDYGKDGKLTEDEIKNIKDLDVSYKEINSLKGIEYFTALSLLVCNNNLLATLDVSKNTALTEICCNYNQLTSLDISKNTKLKSLYCNDNQLPALDVSKNSALKYLVCSNNRLTVLDVSRNTTLTWLVCDENQLTTLGVSECTALTWLLCDKNQLTTLDVSECIALKHLSCPNNQLTNLDVTNNTQLDELYVHRNRIKGTSMDNLIKSLPINNDGNEPYKLYVYSSWSSDEKNVCTKNQVKAAKEKGWMVLYEYDNDDNWGEYEGSNDNTSSGISNIKTEISKNVPAYDLRGRHLTAPQKGINIIDGHKVVVK